MASFTTLTVGQKVRVRGQSLRPIYQVTRRDISKPGEEPLWIHELKQVAFMSGIFSGGKALTPNTIVRIEHAYYFVRSIVLASSENAHLETVLAWNYEKLGLPPP